MDGRIIHKNPFVSDIEDSENSPENSGGSPRSAVLNEKKIASTSSTKRSKRGIQKRVVSVPIKDVEGFRLKGDQMSAPPSDSWAWRKYGQKPIKGSPYPRAYYRCSSSKGCPARKQVERNRMDPTMLVVTYACEHNHPWPASRNSHNQHHHHATSRASASAVTANPTSSNATASVSEEEEEEEGEEEEKKPVNTTTSQSHHEPISEYKFPNLGEGPLVNAGEFGWFTDFEPTSCTMLEAPMFKENGLSIDSDEMAMIFTMQEEDESLFADLGELPECSTVFRRGIVQRETEQRRHSLTTTG